MIGTIFKAYDVRATYPDPLDETAAWRVGYATGEFLQKHSAGGTGSTSRTVLVSRDMRPSSPALCEALMQGLRASGSDVIDLGMCDTSLMYFAVNDQNALGGIQTTASHNPVQYNGFKVSGRQAHPVGADTGLKEIAAAAEKLDGPKAGAYPLKGSYRQLDVWEGYRKHILSFLTPLPHPIKVFVDGSNGMAGKMVPMVFGGVPNLEIVPVNFEITGAFVHQPNPLVAENMAQTQQGVREHHAALGACFDGDADRCIMTDEQGRIIGCDHLTALLCAHFLAQVPGAGVVYDLRSSKAVMEEVRRLGGVPVRSRVGHVYMKALLREKGGIFGGELSGHFYFRDNFCADSGAIALAAVLSVLGMNDKPFSQLIAPFQKYPQSGEINFRVEDKAAVMARLKEKFGSAVAVDDLDGVTLDGWTSPTRGTVRGGWWCNVRPSNTEPLLRLNAEAKDRATLDWLLHEIEPMLGMRQGE